MKFFYAEVETWNFTFGGYGKTEEDAIENCLQAWLKHCDQNPYADVNHVERDDIYTRERSFGSYRDGEKM